MTSTKPEGPALLVIGGGKMGEALVGGLLASGWSSPRALCVVEPVEVRRAELVVRFPGLAVVADLATAPAADGALVAVKPDDVEAVCRALSGSGPRVGRVLSIAAGVPLSRLEGWLGDPLPVIRAMPNTAALVGAGASAIAAGSHASPDDVAWARAILSAVGRVEEVPEHLLDAVTGLSGSGPAYVFLVAEALVDAGVNVGLPRRAATALALQTILGAARLLTESGDTPEALRAAVTSPGGTTAAGLRALEARAVRSAFIEAVAAATDRSRQLGSS